MPIPNSTSSSEKTIFYTERYKTLIRSEKEILLREAVLRDFPEANVKQAFKNDFYRLLRSMGIPPHLHWTIAFINDVLDPDMDISGMQGFYDLAEEKIAKAISRANTVRG